MTSTVHIAGLVAPRRRTEIGRDGGRSLEARRIFDRGGIGQRNQRADAGDRRQSSHVVVGTGSLAHQTVEHGELLPRHQQHDQHRLDDRGEHGVLYDPLSYHRVEPSALSLAQDDAECLENPRMQFVSLTFCVTSCARATSMARVAWVSMLLTAISRYQPTRTICAIPWASLASVLLICSDSAALA